MNKQTKETIKRLFFRFIIFSPIIFLFYSRNINFYKNVNLHILNFKNFTNNFPSMKFLENDLYLDYPDIFSDFFELVYLLLLGLSFMMIISSYLYSFLGFILVLSYSLDQMINEKFLHLFILEIKKPYYTNESFKIFFDENLLIYFAVVTSITYFLIKN